MKRLLTLLLLSIVFIPLSARNYTVRFYDSSNNPHDVSLTGSGPWTNTISGSTMAGYVKDGEIRFEVLIGEQGNTNTYYHANSSTYISSGTSYTYYKYGSGSGGNNYITWNSAYSSYTFTITATATNSDGQNVNLTISWGAPFTPTEIATLRLKGTFNSWNGTEYDSYSDGIYTWNLDDLSGFTTTTDFKLWYGTGKGTWVGNGITINTEWKDVVSDNTGNMKSSYATGYQLQAKQTGTNSWQMRVVEVPHDYYWVSPQVTNGQKLPYFKMVASRNRSGDYGDGKISTKYFTFTMKDDDFRDYNGNTITNGTTIQWYIVRDDNKVFYRPATELAYNDTPASYSGVAGSGDLDSYVKYKNYWNGDSYAGANAYKTTDATRSGSFAFRKGDHKSVTFNMNADKGHIFFNYVNTGLANPSTTSEFYLIGNFKAASETESISISDTSHKLTRLYYTERVGSETYSASCDSVVYVCTVYKPTTGDRSWGNLYLDVNPSGNVNWGSVYRPLINLYNGLDGRALVGGLTTAGQGGDDNKGDQSLNPETSDKYTSYEFRFNATTMTYRITFHTSMYLVGPGVSSSESAGSWDMSNVATSDPRIRLTATQEVGHYRNYVYFTNGNQFRFIQNTDEASPTYQTTWMENNNAPKFSSATTDDQYTPGNETQYKNYLDFQNGTGSSSNTTPSGTSVTFDLPDGWYYVNFYENSGGTPYYTIERQMDLRDFNDVYYRSAAGTAEKRNVLGRNDYNFLRVWSDHIAWNKPDNIDVFVVSAFSHDATSHTTTATLTKLDINYIPAKTGVILGCKLSKDNLTSGLVYDNAATLAYNNNENVNYYNTLTAELTPYSAASTSYSGESKLIPLYSETSLKRFSDETGIGTGEGYANYLFGFYRCKKYKQNYTGNDNDFDMGFWLTTGNGTTYANSAFLHLTKTEAEDLGVGTAYNTSASAPAFMLLFDESDDNVITGISDITTAKGNSVASQGWYTLQGVRTAKPTQRGIYIYNGKKVIVND